MSGEDRELLKRLRKLRARIPNFGGVVWDRSRRQYRASLKNGKSIKTLGWYSSELAAFRSYLQANAAAHPRDRINPFESPARIAKLLALAARCQISVRPEAIFHSSLDPASNALWSEAGGRRISRRALAE